MKRPLLKTLLAGAALTAALAGTAFASNVGAGVVQASALNLRAEPSTASSSLTMVHYASGVVVTGEAQDGWYPVIYRGQSGYMSAEYLRISNSLNGNFGTGTIQGSSVRMRAEPNTSSQVLGTYNTGTQMQITGVNGAWYKVSYNSQEGYVSSDYMKYTAGPNGIVGGGSAGSSSDGSVQAPADAGTAGEKIVTTAMQYLGVPYVWAGTSPSGFDCSGLVYYVYRENGYSTNRTAASLYENGVAVDRSELQPGDVICFTNGGYSYIGHTGIYVGDNKFIHASSGGGRVIVSSLSETYYNNHYYGARRIVS